MRNTSKTTTQRRKTRSERVNLEYFRIIRNCYRNHFKFFDGYDVREIDRELLSIFKRKWLGGLNKSKLPVPLNDKALDIAGRNIRGKFLKDFLFVNPATGGGYRRKYL
jgi:hypothetical protein